MLNPFLFYFYTLGFSAKILNPSTANCFFVQIKDNMEFGLAMQLRKYIWILQVVEWMKCMSDLTNKFVLGITLFTQIIVSFLVDKKYKCCGLTDS